MNHSLSKVGTTRSGRDIVIYLTDDEEFTTQRLAALTLEEHFDAWAVFQRLAIRAKRKCGEGAVEFKRYVDWTRRHELHLTEVFIAEEKVRLKLSTVFDLMRFAVKHTDPILT